MIQYKVDLHPRHGQEGERVADDYLEEYALLSEASNLEKKWMHERLSWLFTPQSFLFAALGLLFSDKVNAPQEVLQGIRIAISLVGVCVSALVFLAVFAACMKHREWTLRMRATAERYTQATGQHLTFGSGLGWPAPVARWVSPLFPVIFFAAWFYIMWEMKPSFLLWLIG